MKPGIYRHFKGNLYRVLGVAQQTETQEPLVIYCAEVGPATWWARPLSMFTASVRWPDGVERPRFDLEEVP